MNSKIRMQQNTSDTGFFQANITSTLGSRPISGAKVEIRDSNFPDTIIEEVETDTSGQTDVVSLPAPPIEYSLNPVSEQPYTVYNIRISAPGFETIEVSGAEILPTQTALQNTALLPLDDALGESEELYVVPPHTLYGDYPPKIPENEIKDVQETGEIVLSRVVIPAGVRLIFAYNSSDTPTIPFLIFTAFGTIYIIGNMIYGWLIYSM